MVAVGVLVGGAEDVEGSLGEVFCGRYDIKYHGLVIRQAGQKVAYRFVAAIYQKSMVPCVHNLCVGDALDIGEVHHHALFGQAFAGDDVPGQRDLDRIAMAVQVFALAVVVGDTMSGIEFQAAGNIHVCSVGWSGADYTLSDFERRCALQKITPGVTVIRRAIA